MTKRYPPTQMRQLYEALGYLKEDEQIALAELHVANPKRLSNRLDHSLKTVAFSEKYPPLDKPLHRRQAEGSCRSTGSGRGDHRHR